MITSQVQRPTPCTVSNTLGVLIIRATDANIKTFLCAARCAKTQPFRHHSAQTMQSRIQKSLSLLISIAMNCNNLNIFTIHTKKEEIIFATPILCMRMSVYM